MRLNRPPVVVKAASVAALAAAACAMSALPAGAASAAPVVKYATTTVVSAPATGYTHTDIKLSATEKGRGGNPTGDRHVLVRHAQAVPWQPEGAQDVL